MPLSLVGRDPETAFYGAQVTRVGGAVLVLGSADGELAFGLSTRTTAVVAVEPAGFLVAEAEARKHEHPQAQVKLVQADLRTVRLDEKFGVVAAPRGALSAIPGSDALDAVLATVRAHLKPDGLFVFEVRGLRPTSAIEGPSGRSLFAAHLRERKGTGNAPIRRIRRATVTLLDLENGLMAAGLEAREQYADFEGRPYDEGGDRLIVVAGLR